MKKILIISVAIILVIALSGCTTVFGAPESPANGIEIPTSKIMDIVTAANISINEINQIISAIDELNVKAYGVNGTSRDIILAEYIKDHMDWTLRNSENDSSLDWNVYIRAWSKFSYVHLIVIIDGWLVKQLSNYDVLVLTSHGQYFTFQKYFEW